MDFTQNQNYGVEAYRTGQFHGAIVGVIASTAAYYLFKAYKPTNPWNKKEDKNDEES